MTTINVSEEATDRGARKDHHREKGTYQGNDTLILRQPAARPYTDYDIVNKNQWWKAD
jgi:hypothetical protein